MTQKEVHYSLFKTTRLVFGHIQDRYCPVIARLIEVLKSKLK